MPVGASHFVANFWTLEGMHEIIEQIIEPHIDDGADDNLDDKKKHKIDDDDDNNVNQGVPHSSATISESERKCTRYEYAFK